MRLLLTLEGSGLTLLLLKEQVMRLHLELHCINPNFVKHKLDRAPPAGHLANNRKCFTIIYVFIYLFIIILILIIIFLCTQKSSEFKTT